MKIAGSKATTLAMMMAMATQASPTESMTIARQPHHDFDYAPPCESRMGGWHPGLPMNKKQRKARAATKRQRKARQQQRKHV